MPFLNGSGAPSVANYTTAPGRHTARKAPWNQDNLQASLIDLGSSTRPAVVTMTVSPHVRHLIKYFPQRGVGCASADSQNFGWPFVRSRSIPSGYAGSGGCFGSRPPSIQTISNVAIGLPQMIFARQLGAFERREFAQAFATFNADEFCARVEFGLFLILGDDESHLANLRAPHF